uniref:Macrophage colony-stimulating factor 1 n=1 Tax=Chelydra serpentina TaxID=8475 RepID=A0A8C3XTS0_CHESE
MAGVPDNFSLAQACPISCTLLTFFLLAACSIHETEQKGYCENIITKMHLDKLQELQSQPRTPSFTRLSQLCSDDEICFVKAAFPRLEDILDKMKFKKNSDNFNKTKDVRNMYKKIDENEVPCIDDQDDHERELSQACSKEFSMPPEKMLQLVKNFFSQVMVLLDKNVDFKRDCSKTYQKCSDAPKKELLSPDQRRKEAQPKETQREVMSYVLVAILATVAILLAVGGLLFYKHKSRVSERRPPRSGNDLEEQEGR